MGYDDVKEHDGERYSGMAVGGEHRWVYPDGRWEETKVAPDRWTFTFDADKQRSSPAPPDTGADPGTRFHWYLLAHQKVRKLDKDTYRTRMEGLKYKLAHKRPYWQRWSSEYHDQASRQERLVEILEAALDRVRERLDGPQTQLERF